MADRYIPNTYTDNTLLKVEDPLALLYRSVQTIVTECPPRLPWAGAFRGRTYRGLFAGPTSQAYFFLCLTEALPELVVEGKPAIEWAKAYLDVGQDVVSFDFEKGCGITNERLAFCAVKACVFKDASYAKIAFTGMRNITTDAKLCEWFAGRAGALYILRMITHWLPEVKDEAAEVAGSLITHVLAKRPWSMFCMPMIGAVHGDIGIITQIVLTDPSYAPQLQDDLARVLRLQDKTGNWPVWIGRDAGLVQFCHGAPGFVFSLRAIRQYFPDLEREIDSAMQRAQNVIWEKGLLVKEPNLCHGTTGNGLALDGDKREHFLALATPEKVKAGLDDGVLKKEDEAFGLLWGEAGRAWGWMSLMEEANSGVVLYTNL